MVPISENHRHSKQIINNEKREPTKVYSILQFALYILDFEIRFFYHVSA